MKTIWNACKVPNQLGHTVKMVIMMTVTATTSFVHAEESTTNSENELQTRMLHQQALLDQRLNELHNETLNNYLSRMPADFEKQAEQEMRRNEAVARQELQPVELETIEVRPGKTLMPIDVKMDVTETLADNIAAAGQ